MLPALRNSLNTAEPAGTAGDYQDPGVAGGTVIHCRRFINSNLPILKRNP